MKLDRTSYFRVLRIANGAEFKDARARVVVSPDAFASGELSPGRWTESEDLVVNRTVVLLALTAMACGAIQASAPQSKPSTSVSPNRSDLPSAPYATVTDERLQHPEAGGWLMYRRTYDGSGFSPLSQITAKNIGNLSLAWSLNTIWSTATKRRRS